MEARVISLCLSQPKQVSCRGEEVTTGIFKTPVDGPVFLSANGLEGATCPRARGAAAGGLAALRLAART